MSRRAARDRIVQHAGTVLAHCQCSHLSELLRTWAERRLGCEHLLTVFAAADGRHEAVTGGEAGAFALGSSERLRRERVRARPFPYLWKRRNRWDHGKPRSIRIVIAARDRVKATAFGGHARSVAVAAHALGTRDAATNDRSSCDRACRRRSILCNDARRCRSPSRALSDLILRKRWQLGAAYTWAGIDRGADGVS